MRFKCFISLMLLLLVFASCSRTYKIEGVSSVTGLDGKLLYLRVFQDGHWVNLDSTEVVHGFFSLEGVADSVRMASLYLDDVCLMPLVLEKGKIKVDINNLHYTAKGTPLNNALYDFIGRHNQLELQLEELERKEAGLILQGIDAERAHREAEEERYTLLREMDNCAKTFIVSNYENVLGPGVFMMMCSSMPYPMLTNQVESIMNEEPVAFRNDAMVKAFFLKARENMRLMEKHQVDVHVAAASYE